MAGNPVSHLQHHRPAVTPTSKSYFGTLKQQAQSFRRAVHHVYSSSFLSGLKPAESSNSRFKQLAIQTCHSETYTSSITNRFGLTVFSGLLGAGLTTGFGACARISTPPSLVTPQLQLVKFGLICVLTYISIRLEQQAGEAADKLMEFQKKAETNYASNGLAVLEQNNLPNTQIDKQGQKLESRTLRKVVVKTVKAVTEQIQTHPWTVAFILIGAISAPAIMLATTPYSGTIGTSILTRQVVIAAGSNMVIQMFLGYSAAPIQKNTEHLKSM